jgi:hypothetical protein
MEIYQQIYGNSVVHLFEIGQDFIDIQFYDSQKIYRFSYARAGRDHVTKLKKFANCGDLLDEYIRYFVFDLYDN